MRITMRRIHIVGTSGSGKTTLAREIAARLNIPHVELDALHWQPDWTPAARDDLRARVTEALSGGAWVVDGNYSLLHDLTLAQADTIIWLDYALPIVLWRVTRRTTRRIIRRTELWNDNRERLGAVFSRDSIILWALTTWGKNRRRYRELLARPEYAHLHIIHLRSPRETRIWLRRLAVAQSLPVH
jgi:adenylate kinase family enzyme